MVSIITSGVRPAALAVIGVSTVALLVENATQAKVEGDTVILGPARFDSSD